MNSIIQSKQVKIKDAKDIDSMIDKPSTFMKFNIVTLNNVKNNNVINKIKNITAIWKWRNFVAVDSNWNILWFVTLTNNFTFYPSYLKWNWGIAWLKTADPLFSKIVKDTNNNQNLVVKKIEWTDSSVKILKLNKAWYSNAKWVYFQFVNFIWNEITPEKFTFNLNWNDITLNSYWVYNVDNWQLTYIKN